MLELPEGDTAQAESGEPDAAPVTTPVDAAATQPAPADKPVDPPAADKAAAPVILAKDGVHTISYDKLVDAREEAKSWRDIAAQATAQLEALQKAPAAPAQAAPAGETQQDDGDDNEFGDFSEGALKAGIEKVIAKRVSAVTADLEARFAAAVEPIRQKAELTDTELHFTTIEKAHKDFESVATSQELANWISKQPSFAQAGYQAVLQQGTAAQVVELLDTYKAATGKLAPPPASDSAAVAAAQAAIAKAQSKPPTSLSDLPAGSAVAHDPAQAMLEMSGAGAMALFDGKTPEQINALISRVL